MSSSNSFLKGEGRPTSSNKMKKNIVNETDETVSAHSDFKGMDHQSSSTKQADSAYGSHDTSQCHRSSGSSSKGASNLR